jgi:uncharacterized membrane protein HdeD (DUF308 family)
MAQADKNDTGSPWWGRVRLGCLLLILILVLLLAWFFNSGIHIPVMFGG